MGMQAARITDDVEKVPMQFRIFLYITLKSESDGHRSRSVMESVSFDETVPRSADADSILIRFLPPHLRIKNLCHYCLWGTLKDRVYV